MGDIAEESTHREEYWSWESSPRCTQLCPGTAFFVSTNFLRTIQFKHGPATKSSAPHRYGWEIIKAVLGPEKLHPDRKQETVGLMTMLKEAAPDQYTNIFNAIAMHVRELFGPSMKRDGLERSIEEDRKNFRNSCTTFLSKISIRNNAFEVRDDLSTKDDLLHRAIDDESVASYIRKLVRNNPAVSEQDLERMIQDEQLQGDVDTVTQLMDEVSAGRKHQSSYSFRRSAVFAKIQKSKHTASVHVHLEQVRNMYRKERNLTKGITWQCNACRWRYPKESAMQEHVVKRHFLQSMGVETTESVRRKRVRKVEQDSDEEDTGSSAADTDREDTTHDEADSFSSTNHSE